MPLSTSNLCSFVAFDQGRMWEAISTSNLLNPVYSTLILPTVNNSLSIGALSYTRSYQSFTFGFIGHFKKHIQLPGFSDTVCLTVRFGWIGRYAPFLLKKNLMPILVLFFGYQRFKIINVKNSNSVINFTSPLETLSNKRLVLPFCKWSFKSQVPSGKFHIPNCPSPGIRKYVWIIHPSWYPCWNGLFYLRK